MDRRLEQDVPQRPGARRFEAIQEQDRDALYPMVAPAAAVAATSEEEPADVAPAAGHVNV
jgi:hypothetical protein